MPAAVFADGTVVVTNGANAERDLLVHTEAAKKTGISFIRVEDAEYKSLTGMELRQKIIDVAGFDPSPPLNPAPDPIIEKGAKAEARQAAFDDAIARGKTHLEAVHDGQAAYEAAVDVAPL